MNKNREKGEPNSVCVEDFLEENNFRILIEESLAGFYIVRENRFIYVNPAFAKMSGYSQYEIIHKKTLKDLISPESYGEVSASIQNKLAGKEKTSHYFFKGLRRDNSIIDIEVLGATAVIGGKKCAIGTVLDVTEQSRAHEEIRKLSRAVKQSPASVVITDLHGNIEYVNPKFTQVTGYSLEEVLGRNPRVLKSGDKSPEEYKKLWAAITSGKEWRGEFHNRKKNGELFWEFASISPIKDPSGKITHFLAVKEDITERKRVEQEIARRLEFERVVSTISSRFVASSNIDNAVNISLKDIGVLSGAGRAYLFLFSSDGKTMDNTHEWCAESVSSHIHELKNIPLETFPWLIEKLQRDEILHVKDVSDLPAEAENERKEFERENIMSILIIPVRQSGNLAGFVGFDNVSRTRDWTDIDRSLLRILSEIISSALQRQRIEAEKAEAIRLQEAILNNIPDIAWLKDREGRFIAVNEPFVKACGFTRSGLIGKTDMDIWPEELAKKYMDDDKEVMRSERHKIVEEPLADMEGKISWIETIKTPIFNEKAEVIGTTGIARNVTGRKMAEDAMKQINNKLKNAYEELKAAQSQILQHEKMASIGQLAAGVAHEINNPMGFIISNLGSLQKYLGRIQQFITAQSDAVQQLSVLENNAGATAEQVEKLKHALKLNYMLEDSENIIKESLDGADRVKKIVQDLKSFSRVDESEIKEANINSCLDSTINIAWNELKYKATMHKDYGNIPLIKCNPGQINQIFMNILVNAAQSIEKQGDIYISTKFDNGYICITIKDTGCGISEDKISRIFEPFYTTKEVGKGTGLGLSIVYDIIKKHKGEIDVRSRVGEGTSFIIKLPVGDNKK